MAEEKADSRRPLGQLDFQQLVESHGDRLIRSAFLLCGDASEAQDLVQETFVQALKGASRFRGDSSDYTWLYGILRNLCFRHLRIRKRLSIREEVVPEPEETASDLIQSESDVKFCSARLSEALQSLSPDHREVILLRYYENLRIEEIALRTGVSNGTVKSRVHYAVRALRQFLPTEMNVFATAGTNNTTGL
jgi:RNA polymerase sigma-70 factor (ECF subfamily)